MSKLYITSHPKVKGFQLENGVYQAIIDTGGIESVSEVIEKENNFFFRISTNVSNDSELYPFTPADRINFNNYVEKCKSVSLKNAHREDFSVYKYYTTLKIQNGEDMPNGMIAYRNYQDGGEIIQNVPVVSEVYFNRVLNITEFENNPHNFKFDPAYLELAPFDSAVFSDFLQSNPHIQYQLSQMEFDTYDEAHRTVYDMFNVDEKMEYTHLYLKKANDVKQNVVSKDVTVSENTLLIKDKEQMFLELKNGINAMMDSSHFQNFCATIGRLYLNNYSLKNAMLVNLQRPTASYVMGYEKWKEFGRQVKANSQGIKIFVPYYAQEKYKNGLFNLIKKNLTERLQEDIMIHFSKYNLGNSKLAFTMQRNGTMGLMISGRDVEQFKDDTDCKRFITSQILGKVPLYFNMATVFDLNDTMTPEHLWVKNGFEKKDMVRDEDGNAIRNKKGQYKIVNTPERQAKFNPQLDFTIPAQDHYKMETLFLALKNINERKGVNVIVEAFTEPEFEDTKGYFSRTDGNIHLSNNLSPTEKLAVAFHETGHAQLHGDIEKLSKDMGIHADRQIREIQAEAIAYITAKNFGIDTSVRSFQYLAGWSRGKEHFELQKSINYIYKESKTLMREIENELRTMGYNLNLEIVDKKPLTNEELMDRTKPFSDFYIEKYNEYDRITKDVVIDIKEAQSNEVKVVLEKQANVVLKITHLLDEMKVVFENMENLNNREIQEECLKQLATFEPQIRTHEAYLSDVLSRELIDLRIKAQVEGSLKNKFKENPLDTLQMLKNDRSDFKEFTELELSYLSKSPFVAARYLDLLESDIESFASVCREICDNLSNVSSKDGSFIEVVKCEEWGNNKIFEAGTLVHPKLANRITAKAQKEIINLKEIAAGKGEYFPYTKASLVLFCKNDIGGYSGIYTDIDIGSDDFINITEFYKTHLKGSDLEKFKYQLTAYENALAERPRIDLHLKPAPTLMKTKSIINWQQVIHQRKDSLAQEQKEKELDQQKDQEKTKSDNRTSKSHTIN